MRRIRIAVVLNVNRIGAKGSATTGMRSVVIAGLLLFMPTSAASDDFPSALRQLQAVRSVVQAGLTIEEYRRRALDAQVVVDRYLASGASGQRVVAVQKAMENYTAASTAWGYSLSGSSTDEARSISCPQARSWYAASYPNAVLGLSPEGARDLNRLLNKMLLQIFWACVGDYIADAEGKPRTPWTTPEPVPLPALKRAPSAKRGVAPECRAITEKDGTEMTICR